MELVSIIVPVYNVEKYLRRCLDSLVSQTYRNIEIICINDCSPDDSQSIIDEYERRYAGIVKGIKNDINVGLGATRENGIRHSNGTYLMFVDSDDYVDKDWVKSYISVIENENELDVVIGGFTITDINGEKPMSVIDNEFTMYLYASACTRIYKKKFILDNNITFGGIRRSEDGYWKIMQAVANPKYKVIDNVGYHYWVNSESITRNSNNKIDYEYNMETLLDKIYCDIDFEKLTSFQKDMIEYDFVCNVLTWLFLYNKKCGIRNMKKKYSRAVNFIEKYFPCYKENIYLQKKGVKGGNEKVNLLVSVYFKLQRIKIGKIIFYIRAVF